MVRLVLLFLPALKYSLSQVKLIEHVYPFFDLGALHIILQVFEGFLHETNAVSILDLISDLFPILRHDCESLEGLDGYSLKFKLRPLGSEVSRSLFVVDVFTPGFDHLVLEVEVHHLSSALLFAILVEAVGPVPEELLVSHPGDLIVTCFHNCSLACVFPEGLQGDVHQLESVLTSAELFHFLVDKKISKSFL